METIFERSNIAQYRIAIEGLERCRTIIRAADYEVNIETRTNIKSIEVALEKIPKKKELKEAREELLGYKKRLEENLTEAARKTSEKSIVEFIVNKYNGNTDVILPVKSEDLTPGLTLKSDNKTLADKLYLACENVCNNHDLEDEFSFDGYIAFSISGNIEKGDLAQEILQLSEKPDYLGRNQAFYLRAAWNFCLKYEEAWIKEILPKPDQEMPTKKKAVKKKAKKPTNSFPTGRAVVADDKVAIYKAISGIRDNYQGEANVELLRKHYDIKVDDQRLAGYIAYDKRRRNLEAKGK